jgi:hypothetical protein
MDEFGAFGGMDDTFAFGGGPELPTFTGEYAPVSDARSDYAPAPIYEGLDGNRFVLREDYPPGTQFFENSPPPSGAMEWIRPGGGYDQATWLMRTFNDLFGGWGAGSPRTTTGYRPF